MKKIKISFITLIVILFSSCESKQDIQNDISLLYKQRNELSKEVNKLVDSKSSIIIDINNLKSKLEELKIYDSGKKPIYILKLHLKQNHISLSISKHIKDAMNAIDFEIPVDKEFYDNVKVGTEIIDEFRMGSCILYGSFGNWKMTVKNKQIKQL